MLAREDRAERRGASLAPVVEVGPVMGFELLGVAVHRATAAIGTEAAS